MSNVPMRTQRDYPGYAIALCAIVTTVVLLLKVFRPQTPPPESARIPQRLTPQLWAEVTLGRLTQGPADAKVQIVEFADFECPACGSYNPVLLGFIADNLERVKYSFAHFPLGYHRFAMPAARAYECAHAQGKAYTFQGLLFSQQDSLGLKSWRDFAIEAGVPDTTLFVGCVSGSQKMLRIDADTLLARKLKLRATPAIIVNGVYWPAAPQRVQLDSILRSAYSN